jgi:putative membrane protein
MQIFLFFALFIAVLAVVFAVQNTASTIVSFFIWKFNGSLALVLLVSLAAGALISFFFSLPTNIKTRWTIRQQRRKMNELEANLADRQEDLEVLQQKLDQFQSIGVSPQPGDSQVVASVDTQETKKE